MPVSSTADHSGSQRSNAYSCAVRGDRGEEHGPEAELLDPLDLGHGVIDGEEREHRRGQHPVGLVDHRLDGPVVPRPHQRRLQLGILEVDQPEAHRRESQLMANPLSVEILQPDVQIGRAGRADGLRERRQRPVHPLAVEVDRLVLLGLLAPRRAIGEAGREPRASTGPPARAGASPPSWPGSCPRRSPSADHRPRSIIIKLFLCQPLRGRGGAPCRRGCAAGRRRTPTRPAP